jgi:hypothetical protein
VGWLEGDKVEPSFVDFVATVTHSESSKSTNPALSHSLLSKFPVL